MSKHTKGPWEVRKCGVDHRIIVNNPAKFIASTRTPDDKRGLTVSGEEDEANARLIAAAPELLEACTRAHDALLSLHVCNQDNSFANEIRTLLKAAIAKATE